LLLTLPEIEILCPADGRALEKALDKALKMGIRRLSGIPEVPQ